METIAQNSMILLCKENAGEFAMALFGGIPELSGDNLIMRIADFPPAAFAAINPLFYVKLCWKLKPGNWFCQFVIH